MWCPHVVAAGGQNSSRAEFEGQAQTAHGLGLPDMCAVHEELPIRARDGVTRHAGDDLDEGDTRRVGTAAWPAEGDVLPAQRQFTLVDQEESLWQAGRDIQAEGIVRLEQRCREDQQQVDEALAAQMVA